MQIALRQVTMAALFGVAATFSICVQADDKRKSDDALKEAASTQAEEETKRAELIESVVDSLSKRPEDTGIDALERIFTSVLDAVGACSK